MKAELLLCYNSFWSESNCPIILYANNLSFWPIWYFFTLVWNSSKFYTSPLSSQKRGMKNVTSAALSLSNLSSECFYSCSTSSSSRIRRAPWQKGCNCTSQNSPSISPFFSYFHSLTLLFFLCTRSVILSSNWWLAGLIALMTIMQKQNQ